MNDYIENTPKGTDIIYTLTKENKGEYTEHTFSFLNEYELEPNIFFIKVRETLVAGKPTYKDATAKNGRSKIHNDVINLIIKSMETKRDAITYANIKKPLLISSDGSYIDDNIIELNFSIFRHLINYYAWECSTHTGEKDLMECRAFSIYLGYVGAEYYTEETYKNFKRSYVGCYSSRGACAEGYTKMYDYSVPFFIEESINWNTVMDILIEYGKVFYEVSCDNGMFFVYRLD